MNVDGLTDCDYYKTDEQKYTEFTDLSNIKDAQPTGYYARIPIYIIGPRDGHIILSTRDNVTDKEFVYEFLFGGYGNTKMSLRKRIQSYPLTETEASSVISELRKLKVLIEVTKDGHIRVYVDNKQKPIMEAYDPFVFSVQYLSFASYQGASVEFLYNCSSDNTTVDINTNEITKQPQSASNDLSQVPLDVLKEKCEAEETWELEYKRFNELKNFKNSQADGYQFKLNFFVYGEKEVHILLSSTEKPNIDTDVAYEIVIGGYGGTRQVIRKTIESPTEDIFEKVQLKDLISKKQQSRVLIQMTKDGLLEVFVGEFQYKPVVKVFDPNPLDLKYVSFASHDGARVLYFYNCDDEKAAKSVLPVTSESAHPLLAEPTERNEEILTKNCKHVHAWEDIYSPPLKLDSIKNSKPDGFKVQLPLLIKGVRDSHILINSGSSDPKDGYEIVLGGWGDTKHLIRKNGDVVAKVNEFNVLNEFQPIKVIIEMTQNGELRIFTDANKYSPLLEFKDSQPIENLNTFSFTAYFRDLDFYYDCSA